MQVLRQHIDKFTNSSYSLLFWFESKRSSLVLERCMEAGCSLGHRYLYSNSCFLYCQCFTAALQSCRMNIALVAACIFFFTKIFFSFCVVLFFSFHPYYTLLIFFVDDILMFDRSISSGWFILMTLVTSSVCTLTNVCFFSRNSVWCLCNKFIT